MKLYSRPLSPFSARVRVALHSKNLPFDMVVTEMGWSKAPAFLELNPLGRIPVLVLDDGTKLIESGPIVEYLEDAFPTPAMLPSEPAARARVRALTQIIEHDALGALMPLFALYDKKRREAFDDSDAKALAEKTAKLHQSLAHIEAALPSDGLAFGKTVTMADAMLLPVRFSLESLMSFGSLPDLLKAYPRTAHYRDAAKAVPALARVWDEMDEGLKAFMAYLANARG